MKNFLLIIAICFAVASTGCLSADAQTTSENLESATRTTVQLDGLVTSRKKYSFTVNQRGTEYTVKLNNGVPVALKMNKPWFDWEKQQVVVDAVPYPSQSPSVDLTATDGKRVAVPLPADELNLISRIGDAAKVKQFNSAEIKRLNFYLVTPQEMGEHLPTAKEPYFSGAISIKDNQAHVLVDGQTIPVRFGFRYATMNGFSIAQLEPNKTRVSLTGIWEDGESEIQATRILFEPVTQPDDPLANSAFGSSRVAN